MNPRSMPPAHAPVKSQPDLESTAELPVLDAAGVDDAATLEQTHAGTDQWAVPSSVRAALETVADEARGEGKLQSLVKQLRETQELLATRGERLAQLEHARDEARSAHADAEERATTLSAELERLRDEAQRAHADSEQRLATV